MSRQGVLGVGVIGASWAGLTHIPAIHALPDLKLAALSTSRHESARAAAEQFGAPRWFTNAAELAACPAVDIVVVAVKVPMHDELVRAAVSARKHIYCEWPLALDLPQAQTLAALAESAGIHHVIGLQGRSSAALNYVRDLVADGYVGSVHSAVAVALLSMGADSIAAQYAYQYDKRNGANALTIASGHLIDTLCFIVGEPVAVTGQVSTRKPRIEIEGGGFVASTSPDTVVFTGTLPDGAVLTSHVAQARVAAPRTRIEITGDDGVIVVEVTEPAWEGVDPIIQISPLAIYGARRDNRHLSLLEVPERYHHVPATLPQGPARNVGEALARLASDIRNGERRSPDFHLAAQRHRLLHALAVASASGRRQQITVS